MQRRCLLCGGKAAIQSSRSRLVAELNSDIRPHETGRAAKQDRGPLRVRPERGKRLTDVPRLEWPLEQLFLARGCQSRGLEAPPRGRPGLLQRASAEGMERPAQCRP